MHSTYKLHSMQVAHVNTCVSSTHLRANKIPCRYRKDRIHCKDRIKHVYPRNKYQLSETLFDKLDLLSTPYTKKQQLFLNLAAFDFESNCVREEQFKDTETAQWIGKHVPISVSISSNMIEISIFSLQFQPGRID